MKEYYAGFLPNTGDYMRLLLNETRRGRWHPAFFYYSGWDICSEALELLFEAASSCENSCELASDILRSMTCPETEADLGTRSNDTARGYIGAGHRNGKIAVPKHMWRVALPRDNLPLALLLMRAEASNLTFSVSAKGGPQNAGTPAATTHYTDVLVAACRHGAATIYKHVAGLANPYEAAKKLVGADARARVMALVLLHAGQVRAQFAEEIRHFPRSVHSLAYIRAMLRRGGLYVQLHYSVCESIFTMKPEIKELLQTRMRVAKVKACEGVQLHWLYRPGGPRVRTAKAAFEARGAASKINVKKRTLFHESLLCDSLSEAEWIGQAKRYEAVHASVSE